METNHFSHLLNHIIKKNLLTDNNLLTLDDISSLGDAEEKVLSLPRAKRRELISKIHSLKKEKFESGKPIVSEEITALSFSFLVSLNNDFVENKQIQFLEKRLKEKSSELKETNTRNDSLPDELQESTHKVTNFKSDKVYIIPTVILLIFAIIGIIYIHEKFEISWYILSIPILVIISYLFLGCLKGFSKGWTIVTTIASLIFPLVPILINSQYEKDKIGKEGTDVVNIRASGLSRKMFDKKEKNSPKNSINKD